MKKKLLLLVILLSSLSGELLAQASKRNKIVEQRVIDVDFNKTAGSLNTMFYQNVNDVTIMPLQTL